MNISWSEIISECGNFRNGFVAVFRKYEGMPTDEKDARNHTVKVTMSSFARHLGVQESTFRLWVKAAIDERQAKQDQVRQAATRARHVVRTDPTGVVNAIMEAPERTQDEIYHELKLRRAGVDTSTANRKAAEAASHRAIEPIRRALASTDIALCVAALNDATEHLQTAISAGALNDESMDQINAAHDAFAIVLAEAKFSVS